MRSPLNYGAVIYPSETAMDLVWEKVKHNRKEMLARGLLTEYAHNEALDVAGVKYELTATTNVYDRSIDGVWQDDKLATRNDKGELSGTHTISAAELEAWLRQPEVIIHSFEETLDGGSLYRGWISFRLLVERELLVQSKYDNTFFFARINALICTRIVNSEPTDDLYNRVER